LDEVGEIRTYDTDGSGYFDRWEYYRADRSLPVRIVCVEDEQTEPLPFNEAKLRTFYTERLLPEALAANATMLDCLQQVHAWTLPDGLAAATEQDDPALRRYAQDVAREMHYQEFITSWSRLVDQALRAADRHGLKAVDALELRETQSQSAWRAARLLRELDDTYGTGDFKRACELLNEIAALKPKLGS
jgi:hypothetical protein